MPSAERHAELLGAEAAAARPLGSRIYEFSGGLIEASWLAALAIVPVLYNPHALSGFQPAKVDFLRIFAIIALFSWIVRGVGSPDGVLGRARGLLGRAPLAALVALALAYVLANCFSVYPEESFWGSSEFKEGTLTFFAAAVVLAAVAVHLRTWEQMDRMVTMIIASSLPVAVYAVIQRAGYDPLNMVINRERVPSTIGHPIYLSGYLLMVLPLTYWRILCLAGSLRDRGKSRGLKVAAVIFHSTAAALQLAAFVCAQSRGPLLGLGASSAFMAIGYSAFKRNWQVLRIAGFIGVLGLAVLFLLGSQNSPLHQLASIPGLQHYAATMPGSPGGETFRRDLWKVAPRLMLSPTPLPFPAGGEDRFHWLRPLIGFGPETLGNVLPHYYTVPDINAKIEDRFHNIVWDTWYGIGVFGLAALVVFVLLLFKEGYRRLGWIREKGTAVLFWMLALGGGAAGSGALWIWGGAGFAGLGFLFGLVAALAVYPLLPAFRLRASDAPVSRDERSAMLLIALLGAIAGHLTDMGFSFPTTPTLLLLSVYAGAIAALGRRGEPDARGNKRVKEKPDAKALWECSIFSSLILATVAFSFVQAFSAAPLTLWLVLTNCLTLIGGTTTPSHFVVFFLIPSWAVVNFAFASNAALRGNGSNFVRLLGASAVLSSLFAGGYLLLKAGLVANLSPIPDVNGSDLAVLSACHGYEWICLGFAGLGIGLTILAGAFLSRSGAWKPGGAGEPWLAAAASLGAIALAWPAAILPMRADVAAGWGKALNDLGRPQLSIAAYRRAVAVSPRSPLYLDALAGMLERSATSRSDGEGPVTMDEAKTILTQSIKITSGLDVSAFQQGRLYMEWAGMEPSPARKLELAQDAAASFDEALVFQPDSPVTLNDSAMVDLLYLGNSSDAVEKSRQLIALVRNQPKDWGDICSGLSENCRDPNLRLLYARRAIEAYDSAIAHAKQDEPIAALCQMGKGRLFMALGADDQALSCFLEVPKAPVGEDTWKAETEAARIYFQKGNATAGDQLLTSAIGHAPEDQKENLARMREQIERQ